MAIPPIPGIIPSVKRLDKTPSGKLSDNHWLNEANVPYVYSPVEQKTSSKSNGNGQKKKK